MAWIPEEKLDEIRNQASIVSVISQYVNLKKAGISYKGLCPFHSEKTPSFVVSEAKRIYHCFGCGKGGNVFTFLQDYLRLSFPDVVRQLAHELSISLPEYVRDKGEKGTKEKKELFYRMNKLALLYFKEQLSKSKRANDFLKKREIKPETTALYHLGYAPPGWQNLHDFFKKRGFSEGHLLELGVTVNRENRTDSYDRFRDRIVFPLIDLSQRVVGFGGRGLDEKTTPKYLNSIESPIYHKGRELYGLFQAFRKGGKLSQSGVIIVEGYFDCLLLYQSGFKNVVATMGTALSRDHLELLKRFTDQFYLCFDGDEAGRQASEKSLLQFLEAGILPKIIECPHGMDPDDYVRKQPKEAFVEKIKKSQFLVDFVMDRVIFRSANLVSSKARVIGEMVPYVKKIADPIEQEGVVQRLSDKLQIDEKWIRQALKTIPGLKSDLRSEGWKHEMRFERSGIEVELIEFFAIFPAWLVEATQEKILDLFTDLEVKQMALEMISQFQKTKQIDFPSVVEKIKSPELRERFVKGVLQKESQGCSEKEWREIYEACIKRLWKNYLAGQEKQLLEEIKAIEVLTDEDDKRNELLSRYQKLVKQKQQFIKS